MANYIGTGNTPFSTESLWAANTSTTSAERFSSVTSDTGPVLLGIGSRTITYSELQFESNGLTFRYIGDWEVTADRDLLTSNVSASGSYSQIIVEAGGVQVAAYSGVSLDVDFGLRTGLTLLDLAGAVLDPVFDILFGDGQGGGSQAFANLHLDATPTLPAIAFAGSDAIAGGTGPSTLAGHNGNDFLSGGAGNDVIYGGNGPAGPFESGTDVIYAGGGDDIANGQGGNDFVYGQAGNDVLYGDTGDDLLAGGAGDDFLYGNEGQDRLYGGQGNDVLHGGAGSDLFLFGTEGLVAGEIDVVADFEETASGSPDLLYLPSSAQASLFSFVGPDGYTYLGMQAGSGVPFLAVNNTSPTLVLDQIVWF